MKRETMRPSLRPWVGIPMGVAVFVVVMVGGILLLGAIGVSFGPGFPAQEVSR